MIKPVLISLALWAVTAIAIGQENTADESDHLWGPIASDEWPDVKFIHGRSAVEQDVVEGRAVFFARSNSEPYHINLPALAVWRSENETEQLVVVIQAEKTPQGVAVGMRPVSGGNAVGLLEELEFIEHTDATDMWKSE